MPVESVLSRGLLCFVACGALVGPSSAWAQCEAGQITSPKGQREDGFVGVVISGDVATVTDSLAYSSLGAVYVYRRGPDGPGDWQLEAVLMSPKPDPDDGFGACRISRDVIVVGADRVDAPEFHSGAAYVYRYDPDGSETWNYETTLIPSDGDFGDLFGWSVSVDGDVILIGARNDENGGVPQSGSAYVFRYDGANWVEEAKLTDPEGEELDLFGFSVSIRGNVALVGAGTDDPGIDAGSVFVFRRNPAKASVFRSWLLEAQLTAFDGQAGDLFGWSVKLFGNVALVTAPQDNGQTGSAYVFRYTGTQWAHEIKLTAADPVGPFPFFGWSSSISGDTIIVGAPFDYALGAESGAAHLFRKNRTGWEEVIKLTASDGQAGDFFGASLSVSDDAAFISARPQNATGRVYIFDLDPTPGDLDCDGHVGVTDLLALLMNWGPCDDCNACIADLDGDCVVGVKDLLILLGNWG